MAKRGQGLPLELIVLAAIAAIVLVLIIAFTIGGGSTFLTKIFQGGQQSVGDDLDNARASCNSLCSQAKLVTTTSAWSSSSYCIKSFSVDLDNDGQLGGCPSGGSANSKEECTGGVYNLEGNAERNLNCRGDTINVICSATIGGQVVTQSEC
jgi:hypothetical protein